MNRPFIFVRDAEVEFGSATNNVKLADPYVAFGFLLDEADFGSVAHVRVLDLTNGHRKHDYLATGKFFSEVFDVELTSTGSVSWIARAYDDIEGEDVPAGCRPTSRFSCDYPFEVRKADDHRSVLLDSAREIAPTSLMLGRGTVTWLHGRTVRTAEMRGALPRTGFPIASVALGGLLLLVAGISLRFQTFSPRVHPAGDR